MMHPLRKIVVGLALTLGLATACVSERLGSPAARPGTVGLPSDAASGSDPASSALQPDRARFSLRPVGQIPYDGLTLPLVSPDGLRLASQVGETPSAGLLLARQPDPTWRGGQVAVFDLTGPRPVALLPSQPLPSGLLLGRSADETGFLVEVPGLDGACSIGRVRWPSAQPAPAANAPVIEVLLDDGSCSTDAVLVDDRLLVVARRPLAAPGVSPDDAVPPDQPRFELALFTRGDPDPAVLGVPGRDVRFPLVSPDRAFVVCMLIDPLGREPTEAGVVRLDPGGPRLVARVPAGCGRGLDAAHQAIVAAPALPPRVNRAEVSWFALAEPGLATINAAQPGPPVRERGVLAALAITDTLQLIAGAGEARQRPWPARADAVVTAGVAVWQGACLPRASGLGRALMLVPSAGGPPFEFRGTIIEFGK
ncbi:MAG: hypothetical protein ACKVS8_05820 [Phycisphaerales bacterium]